MSTSNDDVATVNDNATFLYFAFGSNLNSKRIHVNNPSAKRIGVGLLKDYRLDFGYYSQRWKGCVATVVPDETEHVWGAIWEIDAKDMENLDRQEGVHLKLYKAFSPIILTPDNQRLVCRSYHVVEQPKKEVPLPESRYPSKLYYDIIVSGAIEGELPPEYIEKLKNIPHREALPDETLPTDAVMT